MTRTVDRCDIWWASTAPPAAVDLLSSVERSRAGRFRRVEDRRRFVTARALLRLVLAPRLAVSPREVPLVAGCPVCGGRGHGRVGLDGRRTDVAFGVTRRGARVGVAVSDGRPIGVDVEAVETVDTFDGRTLTALAMEALGPAEHAAYRRLSPGERSHAMARWWTRKEAVLKATGDGLAFPLARLHVSRPDRAAALVAWEEPSRATGARPAVRLQDLDPGEGYVGCVAVLGSRPIEIREHDGDAVLRGVARRAPAATCRPSPRRQAGATPSAPDSRTD
jgi:4'-phosphopantetheinyl transferase